MSEVDLFCPGCGNQKPASSRVPPANNFLPTKNNKRNISSFIPLLVATIFVVGIVFYVLLEHRESAQKSFSQENQILGQKQEATSTATSEELENIKNELEILRAEKQEEFKKQKIERSEKTLTEQENIALQKVAVDTVSDPSNGSKSPIEPVAVQSKVNINDWVSDVVSVLCPTSKNLEGDWASGSGALWQMSYEDGSQGAFITTNRHVVQKEDGSDWGPCLIGRSSNPFQEPKYIYVAGLYSYDEQEDMVLLEVVDTFPVGGVLPASYSTFDGCFSWETDVSIGDPVYILGYPGVGGNTITITDGVISGKVGNYWKTSAKIEQGNSGGIAITENGCFLGMPTLSMSGEIESMGYILDAETVWKIIDS